MIIKTLQIIVASWAVLMVSKFTIEHFGHSFPSFLSFLNSVGLVDITILAGSLSFIIWIIYKSGLMRINIPTEAVDFLRVITILIIIGGMLVAIIFGAKAIFAYSKTHDAQYQYTLNTLDSCEQQFKSISKKYKELKKVNN